MKDMKVPSLPEFKVSKNGYEIRSEILALAKDHLTQEYNAKLRDWEVSVSQEGDGTMSTKVSMPSFPGLEEILKTAEKLYSFVNCCKPPK